MMNVLPNDPHTVFDVDSIKILLNYLRGWKRMVGRMSVSLAVELSWYGTGILIANSPLCGTIYKSAVPWA